MEFLMRMILNVIGLIIALTYTIQAYSQSVESVTDRVESFVTREKFLLDKFVRGYKRELLNNMRKKIKQSPKNRKQIILEYKEKFNKTKFGMEKLLESGRLKLERLHPMPALALATPTGFGSNWGSFTIFIAGYNKKLKTNRPEGDAGFALGLGDSKKYVGATLSFANTDLVHTKKVNGKEENDYSKPSFDEGILAIKLHRQITTNSSIALGRSPLWAYGLPKKLGSGIISNYLSYSYRMTVKPQNELFSTTQFSFGIGDKGYLSVKNFSERKSGFAPFFGVGTRLNRFLTAILDYSREEVTIGTSATPFATKPFVVSFGFRNLTKKDTYNRRLLLSMSYSFSF